MMNSIKKNLNVKIDEKLYKQIKIISKSENLKLPQIIEEALQLYLFDKKVYKD